MKAPTACGIETSKFKLFLYVSHVATAPTACAVCDEGCEVAEERSDDEALTSLVPDRREGKTKRME